MKQFIACKAVIQNKKKQVLMIRESAQYVEGTNVGKFDFPGGRINVGEQWHDALQREVKEEVGLSIDILKPLYVDEWRPVVKSEQWQVIGVYFLCTTKDNTVYVSNDHTEARWVDSKKHETVPIIENLKGVFERL